jgi:DNA repair protein RadD
MELRPYQRAACDSVHQFFIDHGADVNPCVVIPTGGGKTPVMAMLCAELIANGARVLIMAHVQELVQQTYNRLVSTMPEFPIGVYSAGLKRRDVNNQIIVGNVQSIARRIDQFGQIDYIFVDEAHLIPHGQDGQYNMIIEAMRKTNPSLRVVGFTATPYRLKGGVICSNDHVLNKVSYEIGVSNLIDQKYLCKPINKRSINTPDLRGIKTIRGDFAEAELVERMMKNDLVMRACFEILSKTQHRNCVLIFAITIAHMKCVAETLRAMDLKATIATVDGTMPSAERSSILEAFKAGKIKYLVNVGVLTTGFDATMIDCVVLLRPTQSPGLYYQMVGRGFRLHAGKADFLVLDFGDNIRRHGPINQIEVNPQEKGNGPKTKTCPNPHCEAEVLISLPTCPDCGQEFPKSSKERKMHNKVFEDEIDILAKNVEKNKDYNAEYKVKKTTYDIYVKDHPGGVFNGRQIAPYRQKKLRINYHTTCGKNVREWRTLHQLRSWWHRRTNADFPKNIDDAFYELDNFAEIYEDEVVHVLPPHDGLMHIQGVRNNADESVYLLPTIAIRVKTTMGKWPEVVDSMVADVPARV